MSDSDLLDLATQVDQERAGVVAATAPVPKSPYKARTMKMVVDGLNSIAKQIPGTPPVEWEYIQTEDSGKDQWKDPLPGELWLPVTGLANAIDTVNAEGQFDSLAFDPTAVMTDAELLVLAGKIQHAAKDKKLVQALKEGPPEEEPLEPIPPEGPTEASMEATADQYLENM
ncbi:MAG: hypothetical protein ABIL09_13775 [Gemmatimonadota bacterium]